MRYLMILFTLLFTTACSYSPELLRQSYQDLGKNHVREIKQLADFDTKQQAHLNQFAIDIQQWHQQKQLPHYTKVFQDLATALKTPNPIPREKLAAFIDLLNNYPHFNEARDANLKLAGLAKELSNAQYQQMEQHMQEALNDLEEYLMAITPEKQQRQRLKGVEKYAAFVDLDLSPQQREIVRRHVALLADQRSDIITTNRQWSEDLMAILAKRDQADFPAQFARHMLDDNDYRRLLQYSPAATQANRQQLLLMLEELSASLSDQQRDNLANKLQSIADTFNSMK